MERSVVVAHEAGLHARPAAELVKLAKTFQCQVELVAGGQVVNARSILDVLRLGVRQGEELVLRADGEDAEAALQSLARMIEQPV